MSQHIDSLSRNLTKEDFTLRARFVWIIQGVNDNVDHLPNDGRTLDVSVLVDHEEKIHDITTRAEIL
jgi:hypothetical protein